MTLIVDCSIAVKWFLDEEGSENARLLLNRDDLIAPEFLQLECFHAIWKRERRGQAVAAQLHALTANLAKVFVDFHSLSELHVRSMSLSMNHTLAIYDCLYIALALQENAPLITADERQFAAARKAGAEARML